MEAFLAYVSTIKVGREIGLFFEANVCKWGLKCN